MKQLKLDKVVEIKFSVKHPIGDYEAIPCRANIKPLNDGSLQVVDLYYTDPRHPGAEISYHSHTSLKITLADEDNDATDDIVDDAEEADEEYSDGPTPEDVDDMVVDANVESYVHNHILDILIENGLCERNVVLQLLSEYWHKNPHLRLAQIVSNAWTAHPKYRRNPEPDIQDIYYLSDDLFLEGVALLAKDEPKDQGSTQG